MHAAWATSRRSCKPLCSIVAITETYWDGLHNWNAVMDGYKLFTRDRLGRRGNGIALYARECFDFLELNNDDSKV